jgi:hypothetical protein
MLEGSQFEKERIFLLSVSGTILLISIINFVIIKLRKFEISEIDSNVGGNGSLVLTSVVFIYSVDPSGYFGLYPDWFRQSWFFFIVGVFLTFLTIVFDRTLRVLLRSKGLIDVIPSGKKLLTFPLIGLLLCTLAEIILIARTNQGKYASILGFYAAIMLYGAVAVVIWTAKLINDVERNASKGRDADEMKKFIVAKLLFASLCMFILGSFLLFLSIQEIIRDQPAESAISTDGLSIMIPFLLASFMVTVAVSLAIVQAKKNSGTQGRQMYPPNSTEFTNTSAP